MCRLGGRRKSILWWRCDATDYSGSQGIQAVVRLGVLQHQLIREFSEPRVDGRPLAGSIEVGMDDDVRDADGDECGLGSSGALLLRDSFAFTAATLI
jgi:hypothetical protein